MRENMIEEEKNQFAVLIDADNISPNTHRSFFRSWKPTDFRLVEEFMGTGPKQMDGMKSCY